MVSSVSFQGLYCRVMYHCCLVYIIVTKWVLSAAAVVVCLVSVANGTGSLHQFFLAPFFEKFLSLSAVLAKVAWLPE